MENENRIPVHVSIIMDGNGRWAREQGHERIFGHKKGVETVRVVAEAAAEAGVKYLSLYAFSEENWGRPKEEVDFLMHLMMDSIASEVEMLMKNGVRFRVLGNLARLPEALQQGIAALEEKTRENTALDLILFVSYSGKWDIFQAAKKFAAEHSGEDRRTLLGHPRHRGLHPHPRRAGEGRRDGSHLYRALKPRPYGPPAL